MQQLFEQIFKPIVKRFIKIPGHNKRPPMSVDIAVSILVIIIFLKKKNFKKLFAWRSNYCNSVL